MSAIAKRFSQIRNDFQDDEHDSALRSKDESNRDDESVFEAYEFNISGLKVVVRMKSDDGMVGRISFFSRSNCRDCSAVRTFFKERGLRFVEINIDMYPRREKELVQRTGTPRVPQIVFNEKLFGGLVALNSLRNSGEFDQRLKEMLGKPCPREAPAPPVYGFDDPEDDDPEEEEELVRIVKVLRQKEVEDSAATLKFNGGNELVKEDQILTPHSRRKKIRLNPPLKRIETQIKVKISDNQAINQVLVTEAEELKYRA
ncbi:hypothetical protein LINPERHAP2_LOCUS39175 [Linum perenne]